MTCCAGKWQEAASGAQNEPAADWVPDGVNGAAGKLYHKRDRANAEAGVETKPAVKKYKSAKHGTAKTQQQAAAKHLGMIAAVKPVRHQRMQHLSLSTRSSQIVADLVRACATCNTLDPNE